jgi:putative transposase
VLVAPIDGRLKELIAEVAIDNEMTVHSLEVMRDRVHLFVEADPTLCVAEIVNRFKGPTSRWAPSPRLLCADTSKRRRASEA